MEPKKSTKANLYPVEWITKMTDWAENKNKGGIKIKFGSLMSAIMNDAKCDEFVLAFKADSDRNSGGSVSRDEAGSVTNDDFNN